MQLLLLLPNIQQLSNMRKNHSMLRSKAKSHRQLPKLEWVMIGFVFSVYLRVEVDNFIGLVGVPWSRTRWMDIELYLSKISPKAILLYTAEII